MIKKSKSLLLILLLPTVLFAQKAPKPYGALPTEPQLRWHEMEMYCLIHFTPTTFQNMEWGYGDAEPSLFNPIKFDANQIADAAAVAGFKGLISVAKHHDGFCIWPTATTSYSIKQSPWKNGKGDMVKELRDAAKAKGLKFGVYLSAWDRNDTRYGTSAYTDTYRAQLTELMTNYGPLFISWHDGANGGDGYYGGKKEKRSIERSTYYDWYGKTWPIVRKLQPGAVIFSDVGPDVRWAGNEEGIVPETSWSTFTPRGVNGKIPVPGQMIEKELSSGTRNGEKWIPAECDARLREGWFYHPEEDNHVKTPNKLFEMYLTSVGRGANLDIGLSPNTEGRLHPNDVKSLKAFGKKLKETFKINLAKGAKIAASNIRANAAKFSPRFILDQDRYSYYTTDDEILNPTLEINLISTKIFNIIRLRENIKLGQRLDSVTIETWDNNQWKPLAKATSIGANRLIKLDSPVSATKLRIQLFAPVAPTLSDFALYKEFDEPFSFDFKSAELRSLSSTEFSIKSLNGLPKALDNDPTTFETIPDFSNGVVFEINSPVVALAYLPRQDREKTGIALKYELSSSNDGLHWSTLKSGEFSNVQANPIEQTIRFAQPVQAKFIRLVPTATIGNTFTVAGFRLLKK